MADNSFPASVLIIFTKISWLPEYFIVWISEHAIFQKKEQTFCFFSSFMHSFFLINAWIWVSLIKKKQLFEQKAGKIVFLSKTTSGWDSERWSKQRWSRSSPSTPPKLHSPNVIYMLFKEVMNWEINFPLSFWYIISHRTIKNIL